MPMARSSRVTVGVAARCRRAMASGAVAAAGLDAETFGVASDAGGASVYMAGKLSSATAWAVWRQVDQLQVATTARKARYWY